jgi:hypothetical protein
MTFKNKLSFALLALTLATGAEAYASSISVKCETRGTTRSKISVDGTGLTGTFYAIVLSPPNKAVRSKLPNKAADSNHDVEYDFDSNPADIAAGATNISTTYIQSRTVFGYIRRSSDGRLFGAMQAACSAK